MTSMLKDKIVLKEVDNTTDTLLWIDEYIDEIQLFKKKNKHIDMFVGRKRQMLELTSD